jgi:hypothetical protein
MLRNAGAFAAGIFRYEMHTDASLHYMPRNAALMHADANLHVGIG